MLIPCLNQLVQQNYPVMTLLLTLLAICQQVNCIYLLTPAGHD
jgi:hypothetical protein